MGIPYSGETQSMPCGCVYRCSCGAVVTPTASTTAVSQIAFSRVQGGLGTDLDGLRTGTLADNTYAFVIDSSGNPSVWVLTTATGATDVANGILQPLDYSAVNQRNWIRIL
jgi:sulfite exporter TauE/SafE